MRIYYFRNFSQLSGFDRRQHVVKSSAHVVNAGDNLERMHEVFPRCPRCSSTSDEEPDETSCTARASAAVVHRMRASFIRIFTFALCRKIILTQLTTLRDFYSAERRDRSRVAARPASTRLEYKHTRALPRSLDKKKKKSPNALKYIKQIFFF